MSARNQPALDQGFTVMLTDTQKTLVQTSFEMVVPIADDAVVLFYQRLFELDPALRRMFPADMFEQRRKLLQMLAAAVKGLDRLELLVPVLEDLGRRHARYGVLDGHYETVGAALLWTLEAGLGSAFTPDVKDAWTAVYGLIATTMQTAAHEALAAA
jgi:hemoglobin-like flavoprotein